MSCAGPTWSSTSSEGCVAAIEQACSKICSRLQPHLQQKSSTWETWQATIAEVLDGSSLTPASVMLSAYGFYDGTEGGADGRTTKGELYVMLMSCACNSMYAVHTYRFVMYVYPIYM